MRVFIIACLAFAACTATNGHIEPSWLATATAHARISNDTKILKRVTSRSFTPQLLDQFVAATRALERRPEREEVAAMVSRFDPIWDSTGIANPNAATRYAQRVAAVPQAASRRWAALTAGEPLFAVFSLAALEGIWQDRTFNDAAFRRLVAITRSP
ncbi:MAG: hypothetical protein ACT4P6_13570 [Gemmatimonadaceae bacterium]